MALPGTKATFRRTGLGLVTPASNVHLKIGVSSKGTVNAIYAATDITKTIDDLGSGPLVSSGAYALDVAGGPVYLMRVSASNAGSNGTITRTGTSPSPGLTFTGTPLDNYEGIVQMITGGAVGTATFRASFDGGDNWSEVFATAASVAAFAAETGLTFNFAAGTYVAGDSYTWTSAGPTYSSADLNSALDAVKKSKLRFRFIHVVGTTGGADDATKITNFAALAAAVSTKMAGLETAGKYRHAILEIPDVASAAVNVAGINNFASDRVGLVYGYAEVVDSAFRRQSKTHAGTVVAAKKSATALGVSAAATNTGPLIGVISLYHNEEENGGILNDLGITTLRTVQDLDGFYITEDRIKAQAGSDFVLAVYREVLDASATAANGALALWINAPIRVEADTGLIAEVDAEQIKSDVESAVNAAVGQAVSAIEVTVVRDNNILSTRTLIVRLRVIPFGLSSFVELDAGLKNPANNLVQV